MTSANLSRAETATRSAVVSVLTAAHRTGDRTAPLALTSIEAELTTADARALGITERISSFTTDMGPSSSNRIHNVHLMADYIDGTIVKPGDTFSFNESVGPRTPERGFLEGQMIVGSLLTRPPGMRINLVPLYVWYVLVAAAMILFAFPPLIAGSMLLEIERAFHWPFFNPAGGGDPLLWQHLFWLFGHPEVYIIFLPSVALIAMIVPTFARRPIVGYSWIVLAAVGTGFISFGLWVHHMFTTGLPGISIGLFSAASQAVALPTGVQIFCFIATLAAGRVVHSVPMLYAFGSLVIFVLGGLTGVMVAVAPFNFQAHDTFFVVAHFHYVLIGGALFPILAGCYYFFPLINGKMLSDRLGKIAFWLAFTGFNIAFLPMHWTGMRGMPRRVFTYPPGIGFDTLNLVSTVGAFILAAGMAVVSWDILRPKKKQPYAPRNPWRAGTLEWSQEMPGKPWGIRSIPEIDSRYPLWDQPNFVRDIDQGRFYLPDAEEGRRETIVTTVIDAEPRQCARLPGSSFITLWAALTTGGWKVIESERSRGDAVLAFDLARDAGEQTNVAHSRPMLADYARESLAAWLAELPRSSDPVTGPSAPPEADEATLQRLRALGYVE